MGDNLRERVAAKTAPQTETAAEPEQSAAPAEPEQADYAPVAADEPYPEPYHYEDKPAGEPESVSVHTAMARVMCDVDHVAKAQLHRSQTAGTWRFRGIDDVINALGPAMRRHGLLMVPELLSVERRDTQTTGAKAARETCVTVRYHVLGPAGDQLPTPIITTGESLDNGDKGTAKAMSVAWRLALIQAFCLPTDEPDPDTQAYQRESAPDPAERARGEFFATCAELGIDPIAARKAFARRYGHPIASVTDAGAIAAFTAELGADPAGVLATPAQPEQANGKRPPARSGAPR